MLAAGIRPATCVAAKWEPPDGKVLLFIGQDRESIEGYVTSMGHMPAGIMQYANIGDLGSLKGAADYGAGFQDMPYWVSRRPQVALQIGLYLVKQLDPINAGGLDANIDEMAALLRDTRRPVFLRIGYEFDSDWAGYEPVAYRKAFQRIVERFRTAQAANVAFVWHSWGYNYSFGRTGPEDWYPGDAYVDWCALSIFSPWNDVTRAWMGRSRANMIEFSKRHGKPLMLAEASTKLAEQPSLGEKSWTDWFEPFFHFADSSGAKAISYINADWDAQPLWQGKGWGDSRIQNNDLVKRNWLLEISRPRYLLASDSLEDILGSGADGIRIRRENQAPGPRLPAAGARDWLGRLLLGRLLKTLP